MTTPQASILALAVALPIATMLVSAFFRRAAITSRRRRASIHEPLPDAAEAVITKAGTDRRGQLCRCSVCAAIERCTPSRDFYTIDSDPRAILCESCILPYAAGYEARRATK